MFEESELNELIKDPIKLKEAIESKFQQRISEYDIDADPRVKGVIEKKKELEGKVHTYNEKYKDVDLEKYTQLLEKEKKSLGVDQIDTYVQAAVEKEKIKYNEVLTNKDTELQSIKDQLEQINKEKREFKISDKLNSLVKNENTKIRDKALEKEKRLILQDFEINEDGSITRKDGKLHPTKGKALTLEDYIEELKVNEPHIFDMNKTGTTSVNKTTQSPNGTIAGKKFTVEEALALRRSNPAMYEEARKNGSLPLI